MRRHGLRQHTVHGLWQVLLVIVRRYDDRWTETVFEFHVLEAPSTLECQEAIQVGPLGEMQTKQFFAAMDREVFDRTSPFFLSFEGASDKLPDMSAPSDRRPETEGNGRACVLLV